MPILLLGHTAIPPTHDSVGVVITGTINGRLVTGLGGSYLHETAEAIDNSLYTQVTLADSRIASTHDASTKVALSGLTPSGIDPAGSYGHFRFLRALVPVTPSLVQPIMFVIT